MILDLTDQEMNLVLQALGEMPAKMSYMLIQKIGEQAAAYNRFRAQEGKPGPAPLPSTPPDVGPPSGASPGLND